MSGYVRVEIENDESLGSSMNHEVLFIVCRVRLDSAENAGV
jgi:hypothetical protein